LVNIYSQTPVISSSGIIYAGSGSTVYGVGTLLSTITPSLLPSKGLEVGGASVKFKGNLKNTVFIIIIII
jgi:hypothetical protein